MTIVTRQAEALKQELMKKAKANGEPPAVGAQAAGVGTARKPAPAWLLGMARSSCGPTTTTPCESASRWLVEMARHYLDDAMDTDDDVERDLAAMVDAERPAGHDSSGR
jgi:hypothetical protein